MLFGLVTTLQKDSGDISVLNVLLDYSQAVLRLRKRMDGLLILGLDIEPIATNTFRVSADMSTGT